MPARITGPAAKALAAKLGVAKPKAKRGMNRTEQAYSLVLEARRAAGEIVWWGYEAVRLKLASGAWFKPDFCVKMPDGQIQFHEAKGFMREAANLRLKVANELYPFAFFLVRREAGSWDIRQVGS